MPHALERTFRSYPYLIEHRSRLPHVASNECPFFCLRRSTHRFSRRITPQLQNWAFLTNLHGKPRNTYIYPTQEHQNVCKAGFKQLWFPVMVRCKPPTGTPWIYIQIMWHARASAAGGCSSPYEIRCGNRYDLYILSARWMKWQPVWLEVHPAGIRLTRHVAKWHTTSYLHKIVNINSVSQPHCDSSLWETAIVWSQPNISRHQEAVVSLLHLPRYSHFSCLENFKYSFWKIMIFAIVTLFFWKSDM